jgi:hypothetical protein
MLSKNVKVKINKTIILPVVLYGCEPLGRPRRGCEYGIRIDLGKSGWGGVEWIQLAQNRHQWWAVVSVVVNLRLLAPRS